MSRRTSKGRVVRWPLASSAGRLRVLVLVLGVLFSLCGARVVQIQVLEASAYQEAAAAKMLVKRSIPATRGSIVDRSGQVLAFTESTVNLIADPDMIASNGKEPGNIRADDRKKAAEAPAAMAAIIAKHTGLPADELQKKLATSGSRYQMLARQITSSTYEALAADISRGGWKGIFKENNPRRTYPMGSTASNVVGYIVDGKGGGGLEQSMQKQLAGVAGEETFETSPNGRIPLGTQLLKPATDGQNVKLTIDSEMQWMVQQRIEQVRKEQKAAWAIGLVMDVETGELLSMANAPTFDSNDFGKAKTEDLGNRAVGTAYEPGSVQKVLTLASVLDAGLTTPDSYVSIDSTIKSGDHDITDAFKHGKIDLTTRGVLVRSSNIGAITLARSMEKAKLQQYMANFGLGKRTGVGLPGESAGVLPKATMPDYTRDSMAFGMGFSVTAVQEAAAIATVANGGVYNAPRVIDATSTGDGPFTDVPAGEQRRVISPQASKDTLEMMEQMVLHYKKQLYVDGYRTSAKTGSARMVDPKCNCYKGQVTSIIGVAPTEKPQVLVYVVVARNDQSGSGLGVAGPAYRDIMQLALPRYGVRPSDDKMLTELPLER